MQASSWEEVNHRVYMVNLADDEQESPLVGEEENSPRVLEILFALEEIFSLMEMEAFDGEMLMVSR